MMSFRTFLVLIVVSACCAVAPGALAKSGPKPWVFGWWPSHWEDQDFEPYLEDATHPQANQWDRDGWQAHHWTGQRDSDMALIRDFYRADILRAQYIEDDVPVLAVGPGFYMLGGQDKRRVAQTVDTVYGMTLSRENGMFLLHDAMTGKPIGAYTRSGLYLQ